MELREIQIKDIRIVENHRTNINEAHLAELMQSIKQHGLMQPIGVAPDGKNGYVLRFGQRRYLACKKLGHKTISASVAGDTGKENLLIENLTENMQRKDPSFAEMGRVIKQLEEMELSLSQIAVRLGMPLLKIQQIVRVYDALPEKYRKKVMFMEKGGGRKENKGFIPANAATKIASLKKEHSLGDKDIDVLFKSISEEGMDGLDLNNVGSLIHSGMSAEEALDNVRNYGVFTVDVVAKHADIQQLMDMYSLTKRESLFKKIMYGEIPPLVKPSFISTGLQVVKKAPAKLDTKPYQAIMRELLKIRRVGGLTEAQRAAVEQTNKINPTKWTHEQCQQLKTIHEEANKSPATNQTSRKT